LQLTQKEASLIKDLKGEEKLCIEKYTKAANTALDPQLKDLFTKLSNIEQGHLNTLSKMEQGEIPSSSGPSQQPATSFSEKYGMGDSEDKKADCYLCQDALAIEKHASSVYNTAVFEFTQNGMRDALNHIQKEEQEHGKQIYDYMSTNNMYS